MLYFKRKRNEDEKQLLALVFVKICVASQSVGNTGRNIFKLPELYYSWPFLAVTLPTSC